MSRFVALSLFAAALGLSVQAREKSAKVEIGKPAPPIKLEATQIEKAIPDRKDSKTLSLDELKGKKNVVLFFFPKAMTKGCTIESCGFTKIEKDLADLDTVAIGISTDRIEDQQKFTDKEKLTTPLFADPEKKVTQAYGALNPKNGFASRYTFVIDKQGIVRKIYTMVTPGKHPEEVRDYITENLK